MELELKNILIFILLVYLQFPFMLFIERATKWGSERHGTRNMKREANVMN